MGRPVCRPLSLLLTMCIPALVLLSCSEESSSTGPAPSTGPTVAELEGNWYSCGVGLDETFSQSDTTVVSDTVWLLEITDSLMIDHYAFNQTHSCYCADTLEYTGVSGDTLLGEELTGHTIMTGLSWEWATTYAIQQQQLILTIWQQWQTTYSSSEGSYSTDTTSTTTIYHELLDDGFPASWPTDQCLGCNMLYKRQALGKQRVSSDDALRKGSAADDIIGVWRATKMIELVETDDEWRPSETDTVFAIAFDADSAVVYDLDEGAVPCYATARDTFELADGLVGGYLFAGKIDQGTETTEWSTTCRIGGDTLELVFTVTDSWREAGSGVSSGGAYTETWTVGLLPTDGPMPPAGWPASECDYEWSLHKSGERHGSALFDLLQRSTR